MVRILHVCWNLWKLPERSAVIINLFNYVRRWPVAIIMTTVTPCYQTYQFQNFARCSLYHRWYIAFSSHFSKFLYAMLDIMSSRNNTRTTSILRQLSNENFPVWSLLRGLASCQMQLEMLACVPTWVALPVLVLLAPPGEYDWLIRQLPVRNMISILGFPIFLPAAECVSRQFWITWLVSRSPT